MACVLALDTSALATSVAICDGPRVLAEEDSHDSSARHAERLLPSIERCLGRARLALGDIDVIGVSIGPGSFTGVRVGLATAKGLALSLGKPVSGVVSLEALAVSAREHGPLLAPVLDAFKGEVFAGLYRVSQDGLECVSAPFHASAAHALSRLQSAAGGQPWALLGAGYRRHTAQFGGLPPGVAALSEAFDVPRARHVAELVVRAHARGEESDLAALAPLYVRDSDAQLPKVPLRL